MIEQVFYEIKEVFTDDLFINDGKEIIIFGQNNENPYDLEIAIIENSNDIYEINNNLIFILEDLSEGRKKITSKEDFYNKIELLKKECEKFNF